MADMLAIVSNAMAVNWRASRRRLHRFPPRDSGLPRDLLATARSKFPSWFDTTRSRDFPEEPERNPIMPALAPLAPTPDQRGHHGLVALLEQMAVLRHRKFLPSTTTGEALESLMAI
jgi:hypothetical protein